MNAAPPKVDSLLPTTWPTDAGGNNQQTLTVTASSTSAPLAFVNILVNRGLDAANACYIAVDIRTLTLYLVSDSGLSIVPAEPNSQCTVAISPQTSVSPGGFSVTLVVNFTFTSAFSNTAGKGDKVVYAFARDTRIDGPSPDPDAISAWKTMGILRVWNPSTPPAALYPYIQSTSPNNASTLDSVAIIKAKRQPGGAGFLLLQVLIGPAIDASVSCFVSYHHPTATLYLLNDQGTDVVAQTISVPSGLPLSTASQPANSRCVIRGASYIEDIATGSIELRFDYSLYGTFTGRHVTYAAAITQAFENSGWQAVGMHVLSPQTQSTGWQSEFTLHSQSQIEQNISCELFPGTSRNVCVYEVQRIGAGSELDLHERVSSDGGITWTPGSAIVSHPGYAVYDQVLAADRLRSRIWMLYSRWGYPGNDLFVRSKSCPDCPWSSPSTVLRDGGNHWDASILPLRNGHLLVFETVDGQDTSPYVAPRIRMLRSTDGGATWSAPTIIFDGSSHEWFPVGFQKADGSILLMFREGNQQNGTAHIAQISSFDNGYTWTNKSVFGGASTNRLFSFIGSQGGDNITVQASVGSGSGAQAYHWQSWNSGVSWEGPFLTSTVSGVADPRFANGCAGPIFSFGANNSTVQIKRFSVPVKYCP